MMEIHIITVLELFLFLVQFITNFSREQARHDPSQQLRVSDNSPLTLNDQAIVKLEHQDGKEKHEDTQSTENVRRKCSVHFLILFCGVNGYGWRTRGIIVQRDATGVRFE